MTKLKVMLTKLLGIKILPLFLLLIALSSCPKPNGSADQFDGKWQMKSYTVFAPERPVINEGDIIWTFKSSAQSLYIENKIESQYPYIKKSGEYNYSTTGTSKINIDGQTFDYKFEGDQLTLSDKPELDGPLIIFEKSQ